MNQVMSVQIQLTTKCNERCVFCRKYTWKFKELDFLNLVDALAKYENAYLQFSGGDPLCYSDLKTLNLLLKGRKYKVFTNMAFELNDEQREFLDNADDISVSFDGITKETYNKQRRPIDEDAFDHMIQNVIHYKDKVRLCTVITDAILDEIPKIVEFGSKYEIKTRFYPLHTNMDGKAEEERIIKTTKKLIGADIYDSNVLEALTSMVIKKEQTPIKECVVPKYHRVIDEWGREYTCCYAINDNGTDINGRYAFSKVMDKYKEYTGGIQEYCSRCTRYRRSNEILLKLESLRYM